MWCGKDQVAFVCIFGLGGGDGGAELATLLNPLVTPIVASRAAPWAAIIADAVAMLGREVIEDAAVGMADRGVTVIPEAVGCVVVEIELRGDANETACSSGGSTWYEYRIRSLPPMRSSFLPSLSAFIDVLT